jgi:hypothetical protein
LRRRRLWGGGGARVCLCRSTSFKKTIQRKGQKYSTLFQFYLLHCCHSIEGIAMICSIDFSRGKRLEC